MEIIGCGRYLAKQSSNFGVSSVVVILTAHTLLADKPSTALRQVCSDSLQEGQPVCRLCAYLAIFLLHMIISYG